MAATKKKTTKKSTTASRAKSSPAKAAPVRTKKADPRRRQRNALIAMAVSIILLAVLFVGLFGKTGAFGAGIKTVFFGLFGFTAFAIPLLLFYVAFMVVADEETASVKAKVFQGFMLLALVCAAAHILFVGKVGDNLSASELMKSLGTYFNEGNLKNGGAFGAFLGGLMLVAFDKIVSVIIVLVLIVLFLILVSSVDLADIGRLLALPFRRREYDEEEEEEEEKIKKPSAPVAVDLPSETTKPRRPRFNVDVDLGPGFEDEKPQKPKKADKPAKEEKDMDDFVAAVGELVTETPTPVFDVPEETKPHDIQIDDLIARATEKKEPAEPEKAEEAPAAKEEEKSGEGAVEYLMPPVTLLTKGVAAATGSPEELRQNADKLVSTLRSFGIETTVLAISCGPAVTRYELQPAAGIKISRITSLADDIAMNLAASGVRIEAPIPNKHAIGIEVPNSSVRVVHLREVIESRVFKESKAVLSVAVGKDIAGAVKVADLSKMPHLLIAGATGAGKSVCINSFIISLLYKATPDEVKLIMVDPKKVELGNYNGIPHLLIPVVTDPRKAAGALNWAVAEMTRRYNIFASHNVKDINSYNHLCETTPELLPMARIVIIIDELADLMMVSKNEVEEAVCRLAQLARAAGMHLVLATQRPSVNVITGLIKANIPSRIAFAVTSFIDSRTILDTGGAEKLLGRGDMLFAPIGANKPERIQGCFVSEEEVDAVIRFVRENYAVNYDESIQEEIEKLAAKEKTEGGASPSDDDGDSKESDEKLMAAIEVVVSAGLASTSLLQRKLSLGYARAAKIMDEMEERGIIGPSQGSKPREVLMSRQQWLEMNMRSDTPVTGSDNGDFE